MALHLYRQSFYYSCNALRLLSARRRRRTFTSSAKQQQEQEGPAHQGQQPRRNPISRAINFIRNDPFTRVSILFGGTVLVVLLIVESFIPKPQKRIKPQVAILPPKSTHAVVRRDELDLMTSWMPSFYSLKPSVSMVTGPSGSGKTELVYQFAQDFIVRCSPVLMTKPSKRPIVLYLDAANEDSLANSASLCAHVLGLKAKDVPSMVDNGSDTFLLGSILSTVAKQKAKWLLIIDGVTDSTAAVVTDSLKQLSGYKHRKGLVILTTREAHRVIPGSTTTQISLPANLGDSDALKFFSKVADIQLSDLPDDTCDVLGFIGCSPMSIALAALTVRIYHHYYQSPAEAISRYSQMINTTTPGKRLSANPFLKPLELYVEAMSVCDLTFAHSLDIIGNCNHGYPVPVSLVREHLKNPFYKINSTTSQNPLMSVPDNVSTEPHPSPATDYFSMVKSKLPLIGGSNPKEEILKQLQGQGNETVPVDSMRPLLMSPFIRLSTVTDYSTELMHVHHSASAVIRSNFLRNSIPCLEENELGRAREHWNKTAWFRRFRSFDPDGSLVTFRTSLPGIKKSSALTEQLYRQKKGGEDAANSLSYSQYLHTTSHYHRIATTLRNELKYLSKDIEDMFARKFLLPHVEHVLNQVQHHDLLTNEDALSLETSLLRIRSVLHKASYKDSLCQFNRLLASNVQLHGPKHVNTAGLHTILGELHYCNGNYQDAEKALKQAVDIYENITPRIANLEHSTDHAFSLSLLGLVQAVIGNKQLCVKYLEQSLMMYQSIPSDGDITKAQRKVVATTITDLGHAYTMLGDVNSAKKYLDLAVLAQRGIHGDYHPEVVRALNVQRIVFTLMGNNTESRTLGREIGEIQKELLGVSDII